MNLMDIFRAWRRRWLLTTSLILVALVASGIAFVNLPRTYQASAIVVLLPPRQASRTLGSGNPYLSFSASLGTTAYVLTTELTAPAADQSLVAKGFSEAYTAVPESTTSQASASAAVLPGPFVVLTVTGSNQKAVEHTLYGVSGEIGTLAHAMQAGMPRDNRISVSTLSFTPRATLSTSKTARSLFPVIGLLVLIALSLPLMVDAQITRSRSRRGRAPGRAVPGRGAALPE
jgi:hypothetical protein